MRGWVDREEKYGITQDEMIKILIAESKKNAQLELLNWAMQVCSTGATIGMIRKVFWNKFQEISGTQDRA